MVRVEPGHPLWHDKSLDGRPFECQNCGEDGWAWEADARCEECGATTNLPIEVPEEAYREWKDEQ